MGERNCKEEVDDKKWKRAETMHHFFVKPEQIDHINASEQMARIVGSDVNHAKNVLRIKPGEVLLISDGGGRDFLCRTVSVENDQILAKVEAEEESRELSSRITLYQGLPKSDKMEMIIQKATELGIWQIVPVITRHTVVKLDKKKEEGKQKRWQMIAESAAKQSRRSAIPKILPVIELDKALSECPSYDLALFAYENQKGMSQTAEVLEAVGEDQNIQEIALFIGPEGGFSSEEVLAADKAGLIPVSLGRRVLRTETAGLALLSVLMVQLEIREGKRR